MDWRSNMQSLNDWVLKAIEMRKGMASVGEIIDFIDWQNRIRHSEKEINDALRILVQAKKVVRRGSQWLLLKD